MQEGRRLVIVGACVLLGCGAGPISAGSETIGESSSGETSQASDEPKCEDAWVDIAIEEDFEGRVPIVDDIDADGHLDVVGVRSSTLEIELLWGDGEGGFTYELAPP